MANDRVTCKLMGPSCVNQLIIFSRISIIFETLNGRLPLEISSDRPQTLGKRVSDDPRHFIFRRQKILYGKNVRQFVCRKIGKLPVFEELRLFGCNRQMRLEK